MIQSLALPPFLPQQPSRNSQPKILNSTAHPLPPPPPEPGWWGGGGQSEPHSSTTHNHQPEARRSTCDLGAASQQQLSAREPVLTIPSSPALQSPLFSERCAAALSLQAQPANLLLLRVACNLLYRVMRRKVVIFFCWWESDSVGVRKPTSDVKFSLHQDLVQCTKVGHASVSF